MSAFIIIKSTTFRHFSATVTSWLRKPQ